MARPLRGVPLSGCGNADEFILIVASAVRRGVMTEGRKYGEVCHGCGEGMEWEEDFIQEGKGLTPDG
jgi:hypothetical protein